MANTTPIVTTVTKTANKEKTPKEADAALKANIIDFCEEHYEDILPVVMDKIRHDKRKEVHARLDFRKNPRKSQRVREGSQNSSAETLRARCRNPSERPKIRDHLKYNDEDVFDRLVEDVLAGEALLAEIVLETGTTLVALKNHLRVTPAMEDIEKQGQKGASQQMKKTCPYPGLARISIDGYKGLKAAFLAYFMQQKKYIKDAVEIHNIKQRDEETIEEVMERFKIETRRIKEALECMRISGFMHGVNNPDMKKCLNEHVPKTVEEMMTATMAFIQGETAAASKKKVHTPWKSQDQSKRHTSELEIREIQAVPSTTHGMLKFLMNGGIVTIRSTILMLTECATITVTPKDSTKKAEARHENFKVAIHPDFPDQEITIGGTVSTKAQTKLCTLLKGNLDIFTWQPSDMTGVPQSIVEHQLNIRVGYSFARQKKGQALERAKAIQVEVQKLVEAGILREVYYHGWLSSPIMDCYPLSKIHWKVESLCGYPFKCFLNAYKGYHQIQMAEQDEEKTVFHTSHEVYCYTKMPFGLKNAGATYQRLVVNAFDRQICRNMKIYVDDLVIKSHTKTELLWDIKETFRTLRKINMKFNPKKCTFGAAKEMFLGYMISPEGKKPCPDKTKAVLQLPSTRTIKEVQSLNGKLASLNRFLSKSAKKSLPLFKTLKKCIKKNKSIQEKEMATVVEEEGPTWMTPIIEYLRDETLPGNRKEARKLRIKARQYVLLERILYRRSFLKPSLGCVRPPQADYDAREMIHKCEDFQIYRLVPRHPQQPLTPIMAPWPFYKWGIYIAGPFSKGPGKVKFLIVTMDYFTKRIEAKAVATITGSQVKMFVWDNIVCRFRLHGEIVSDNGKQFSGDPFKDWWEKLNIVRRFASVKHSQSNGLIERENRSLGEGIKAHLEAVIPAEIRMPTYYTTVVDVVHNNEEIRLNLDLLEERREHAAICEAKTKLKMTKYHNARVRCVTFRLEDFFYRSNDASHAVEGGKLSLKWEGPYEITEALGDKAYKLRSIDRTVLSRTWNIANLKKCYL
uniref:Reverse transcriptase domain-containing protein n=1 Tax=Tanacetum cinerariifolium TaxID=118510 RepID=A0A6L2LRS4_TANCI|nr:reverse transcriptase domain-containing protein [Tanacetum cinerariifolium]